MCLWIINYQPGQLVHQALVQLVGFDSIYQENILVNQTYSWPIVQGLFKVYLELKPGENCIHLSTSVSQLTFVLIYQPATTTPITLRLGSLSSSNQNRQSLEQIAKRFLFLTKLVRCTFDEILHKQFKSSRSILFHVEKQFHHVNMSADEFQDQQDPTEIFKRIYRHILRTDFAPNTSVKLILNSEIAPSLDFAYTYKDLIVLNLPEHFTHLPSTFDEFYQAFMTQNAESIFYMVGGYLHELGHLFGLDHGTGQRETIMSSAKGFVESGKDFFLITPRLSSILLNHQCSCYQMLMMPGSSSYSNGLFIKRSQHFQSECHSDIHCVFPLAFQHRLPDACACHGQFHFAQDQGEQLLQKLSIS